MSKGRASFSILAVVALAAGAFAFSGGSATAAATKIAICHRTASNSNPYVSNAPAAQGVINGHLKNHTGPVWPATGQDGKWGDIVPPFDFNGVHYEQNWNDAGQAIFNAGCKIPEQPSTGTLRITKDVDSGVLPEGTLVTVQYDCGTSFVDEVVLDGNGDSSDVSGIPAGAECTVEETDGAGATTVAYSPEDGTATIVKNEISEVTVTNTYSGTVTVTKTVASGTVPAGNITAHLDCDGTEFDQDLVIPAGGGSMESSDIPTGTECTVTETDSNGATLVSYSPSDGVVTIPSGDTVGVTVTNTYPDPGPEVAPDDAAKAPVVAPAAIVAAPVFTG